ncbi:MAG: 3-keto-5-aminohexanoate cleavage protein, partial [Pseudomonadota bacterium]|nr:3-keto-5-aminohexanoate cleavage protein [Pseudomonadota bacterium]
FREEEAACIRHAVSLGGKLRVGFENSQFMADGSIAPNNEARVAEAAAIIASANT